MRIAFVAQHLPEPEGSASGRGLFALCEGLIAAGHDVTVLSWRREPPAEELPLWCEWRPLPSEFQPATRVRALVRPRWDVTRLGWSPPEDAVAIADDVPSFAAVAAHPRSVATFHYLTRFDLRFRRPQLKDVQDLRAERRTARRAALITALSERIAHSLPRRAVAVPIAYPVPEQPVALIEDPVAGLLAYWRWPPNQWTLRRLLSIWPEVRSRVRGARLLLAGRGLEEVRIPSGDGIEPIGSVPRVKDFLSRIAAVVFPCPDTSGPKVKVLESLAYGVPVVTTAAGIEGARLPAGAGAVVSRTSEFADELASLLQDPERRMNLAMSGRAAVTKGHGPAAAAVARVSAIEAAFGPSR